MNSLQRASVGLVLMLGFCLAGCNPGAASSPAQTPTPTLGIGSSRISAVDGMTMVFVPEGNFRMGASDTDLGADADEKPQHTVFLSAYWIDQTEVTNGMYAKCVDGGVCPAPPVAGSLTRPSYFNNALFNEFPVVFVDWNDARKYCGWAGGRLPTEAEWEKAARGTAAQLYPWGDAAPTCSLGNFGLLEGNCTGDTLKVGSHPAGASPYGALDMAGNVWEFVSDWYSATYYAESPAQNPTGPDSGIKYVIRGGSWFFDTPRVTATNRASFGDSGGYNLGFRCVSP